MPNDRLHDLYNARQSFAYADRMTAEDSNQLAEINAEIKLLEPRRVARPRVARKSVKSHTLEETLQRIRDTLGKK